MASGLLVNIVSANGLLPVQCQALTWTSADLLLIEPIKTKLLQKNSNIFIQEKIDGLAQERRNSIANALELRLSCTNPLKG